jgi:L,D-transpeptidase ErfK/SrfK
MHTKGLYIALFTVLLMMFSSISYSKSSRLPAWCKAEGFKCVRVKRGQSWQSLFPNAKDREIVMRLNRTNRHLYAGMLIQVPYDLASSDLLEYSPFPLIIDAPDEKLLVFDPNEYAWAAYDAEGSLVNWGPATGGADWCRDIESECRTKPGNFRIYVRGDEACKSRKFPIPEGGAPMPYCMYFNGGQAFHGSPGGVVRRNESHGCVRLFVRDAEWLRYDFVEAPNEDNNYRGTKVLVLPYSS